MLVVRWGPVRLCNERVRIEGTITTGVKYSLDFERTIYFPPGTARIPTYQDVAMGPLYGRQFTRAIRPWSSCFLMLGRTRSNATGVGFGL